MPDRMLESNKESNALARARNRKKCYSYGVERNTTRIDRSEGKGDDLTANQRDCGDSVAINRPCVAHQICNGVGKAYNQMNGGSANGDAFVD
jgi:hypothetical protein